MFKSMLACSLALLCCLAGCGDSGSGGGAGSESGSSRIRIAVIPKGTTHEFWKTVHAGANKAASENPNVELIWKGPLKENQRDDQIKVVEDMVSLGVDAIVIAPLDNKALKTPVENAIAKGIPVVVIDSDLDSDKYVSFVATDNRKGGVIGGQALHKTLGGKGKVIMLRYLEGSASTQNREEGFLDGVKGQGIEVVSSNQYAGPTVETAQASAERLLAPYKNADGSLGIDGAFASNDPSARGMLRALQDLKQAGKVKFVGFDASEALINGLEKGELDGLVVQNPFNMGYLGVKTMLDHLAKKPVEKRVDTGVMLVTKENLSSPEIKELLHPDIAKWLKE